MREIHPHNRVTSKGKRLGMTVPTLGHQDVGRAWRIFQPVGIRRFLIPRMHHMRCFTTTMQFPGELISKMPGLKIRPKSGWSRWSRLHGGRDTALITAD